MTPLEVTSAVQCSVMQNSRVMQVQAESILRRKPQCADSRRLTSVCKDDGASLEPDSFLELHAILCQQLGCHATQSSKHCPPGVNDLNVAVPASSTVAHEHPAHDDGLLLAQSACLCCVTEPQMSPGKGLWISRETSCVPAVVTGILSGQVVRDNITTVGSQELWSVCKQH